jgi:hypothetical protein
MMMGDDDCIQVYRHRWMVGWFDSVLHGNGCIGITRV